jgi:ABC-type Mn2+/Zn2+ transport system ATPase subunit
MRQIKFGKQYMRNFKCHEELEFSYDPDRFVTVVGSNGAGKSSIFSGIVWACYGMTIEGQTGDSIIRKKSGKDTLVQIDWSDGKDKYEIKAYRKDKVYKNKRFLLRNGVDISEETESETLKKIESLLMPKDVFLNCLLFSQYVKNHFMDMSHSGQKELLDSMLLLDRYDRYYEGANQILKGLDNNIVCIEKETTKLSTIIEQHENSANDRKQRFLEFKSKHELDVDEAKNTLRKLENELKNIHINEEMIEAKEKEVSEKNNNFSFIAKEEEWETERNNTRMSDLKFKFNNEKSELLSLLNDGFKSKFDDINEKINKLRDKKLEISSLSQDEKSLLDDTYTKHAKKIEEKFNVQVEPIVEKVSNLEQLVYGKKIELDEFIKQEKTYKEKSKELEDTLKSKNPVCNLCGQKLRSEDAVKHIESHIKTICEKLNELTSKKNEIELEINDLSKTLDASKKELEDVKNTYKEKKSQSEDKYNSKKREIYKKWEDEQKIIDAEILLNEKTRGQLSEEKTAEEQNIIDRLNIKYKKLVEDLKEENKNNLEEIEKKKSSHLEKLNTSRSELSNLKSMKEKAISISSSIESCKTTLDITEKHFQQEVQEYNKTVVEINNKIQDTKKLLRDQKTQLDKISKKQKMISFWKKGFGDTGIKNILLDESIPILNNRAKELCEYFPKIKLRFNSQTSLKSGDVRNKFSMDVLQTNNLSGLSELSSGERRVVDIMVMLCLRHLLECTYGVKMNILLLDEILDSLDPENAVSAVNIIKHFSNTHCVVLISHTLRDYIESDENLIM